MNVASPVEAAPAFSTTRLLHFMAIAAQLALVLVVVDVFQVEQVRGFLRLAPLVFVGFLIHAWLPMAWRPPFFLLLSMAGIVLLFGANAVWLIGLGLGLVGLCHLPIDYRLRVALVVAAGAGLAVLRAGWVETTWAALVLPILGAMFMFRLVIYLYDLRHERKPATVWERLNYFFLLPNVCFPLFPVIDYQTYRRTYYNREDLEIYLQGVEWIFRGVTHLLFYRLVYYNFIPTPAEVNDLGGVVQFVLTNYLLYLRISGQFHLIIGILCLFGYNLPETHHLYYLASSFNDYWRRINIYWKDFMMKIFYYPSLMRVKKWGMTAGLVVATMVVFLGTWLLHSYQWFWLRGDFPITVPDMLFWGILGLLVVWNALREMRKGRKRSLSKPAFKFSTALIYALKVCGMFVFITLLWALWSAGSVGEYLSMLAQASRSGPLAWLVLVGVLAAAVGIGVGVQYLQSQGWTWLRLGGRSVSFARATAVIVPGSLALLLLGAPSVAPRLLPDAAPLVASLKSEGLNARDAELMERGYYEGLLEAGTFTSALWETQMQQPDDWVPIGDTEAARPTDDLRRYTLRPNQSLEFHRAPMTTNAFGLRDRAYTLAKPDSTYRMVLLGASYEMGGGVPQEAVFEQVAEDRLNAAYDGGAYARYELLNFAVGGYTLVDQLVVTDSLLAAFAPDAVLLTSHAVEERILLNALARVATSGQPVPYPFLRELFDEAGIDASTEQEEAKRRLAGMTDAVVRWAYAYIAEQAHAMGAVPVWVYVPRTDDAAEGLTGEAERQRAWAEAAGLVPVSLADAYGPATVEELRLAPWDNHANTDGHRLLGDALYEALLAQAGALGLTTSP